MHHRPQTRSVRTVQRPKSHSRATKHRRAQPQSAPKRKSSTMKVFDTKLKQEQREAAFSRPDSQKFNYLRDEFASRLLDRVSIIKYDFPNVAILGNDNGSLATSIARRHIRAVNDPYISSITPTPLMPVTPSDQAPDASNTTELPPDMDFENEPAPTPEELDDAISHMQRYSIKNIRHLSIVDPLESILRRTKDDVDLIQREGGLVASDLAFDVLPVVSELPNAVETTQNQSAVLTTGGETSLPHNSQELLLTNLTLHWENDLPRVFNAAHTALKPNGAFIGTIIGGETIRELRSAITLAEMERAGGVSQHVSPFAYTKDIGDLLAKAGFEMISVDVDTITVPYPDMMTLVDHLHRMGEQHAPYDGFARTNIDIWSAANAIYETLYRGPDGLLPCTVDVIMFIGWKHHESMHKPAKRGSAHAKIGEIITQKVFQDKVGTAASSQTTTSNNNNNNNNNGMASSAHACSTNRREKNDAASLPPGFAGLSEEQQVQKFFQQIQNPDNNTKQ